MEPRQLTGVTLDPLTAASAAAHDDLLDPIPDAMVLAEHLDRVGEDLIEHVVSTARAQGASRSQIGLRMGVSKRAAQQRLAKSTQEELDPLDPCQGFTRFSIAGRNMLTTAHEDARRRREPFVTAARLAVTVGIDTARTALPRPAEEEQDLVPYDDGAQQTLVRVFDIAIAQGAQMVEVDHVRAALRAEFPSA